MATLPAPLPAPVTPATATADADVLIVGAGPAGLALACALADAGLVPMLIEQQDDAALADPADDGRDIALTHRARGVLQQLGIWQRLPTDQVAPLREARVIDGPGLQGSAGGPLCFARPPGTEALGWLVPNHHIRRAAYQAARARPAVRWCTGARVTTLALSGPLARVGLADGLVDGRADGRADGRQLAAPLVVAADSRFSGTRRLAGIGAEQRDFGRSVIVGRVAHASVDHQGIAWECFGHGQTLALLPMNQRQCSAVVTVPSDQAPAWLALDDTGFARQVQQLAASRLGPLQAVGPRHHYPLVGVYAHAFSTRRLALVGDAAVGMHPVTAHGYNFGLYGVQTLVDLLAGAHQRGQDIGSAELLARYAQAHRRATWPVYQGTNLVVGLFTDARAPALLARRLVLGAAQRLPGLSTLVKAAITRQLTGGPAALKAAPPWRP